LNAAFLVFLIYATFPSSGFKSSTFYDSHTVFPHDENSGFFFVTRSGFNNFDFLMWLSGSKTTVYNRSVDRCSDVTLSTPIVAKLTTLLTALIESTFGVGSSLYS
jgi:hypothetical protein